jgi:hypothetical protein
MAEVHLNKRAVAQRQFDAAVRLLFSGEDELAVMTIAHAVRKLCEELDQVLNPGEAAENAKALMEDVVRKFAAERGVAPPENWGLKDDPNRIVGWWRGRRNRAANFLKHADTDSHDFLKFDPSEIDFALLEGCALLLKLTRQSTPEMMAFARWHCAVYPNEAGDELETGMEEEGKRLRVHELGREAQLQLGQLLLQTYAQSSENPTE